MTVDVRLIQTSGTKDRKLPRSPAEIPAAGAAGATIAPSGDLTTAYPKRKVSNPVNGGPQIQPRPTGSTATTPASAASDLAGIDFSQFGPAATLRGTQIAPNAQAQTPVAAGAAAQHVVTPESQQLRDLVVQDAMGLSGPDRGQIATDVFGQLEDASQPGYQQRLRAVGQDAARLGRIGSGVTTSNLGDVASEYNRELMLAKRGLATDAASQTLDDRLATLGGRGAAAGQVGNQDLSRSQQYRGIAADEFNRGATVRDELRGERGYQNQLAGSATDDAIRQLLVEDQLLNSAFGRDSQRLGQLGSAGFGSVPTGTLQNAAGTHAGQSAATMDAVAQFIAQYMNRPQNTNSPQGG